MSEKRIHFKAAEINEQGIFTGHASVFGVVDLEGDVVEPGAFAETLATGEAKDGVLILAQHDEKREPLGRSLELREDKIGLYVKGQISDTTTGRDYRQLVKDGVLDQFSIGYAIQDYDIDAKGVRHLRKLELLEISIVNYPANTGAKIESYKGGHHPMDGKKENSIVSVEELQELLTEAAEMGADAAIKKMLPSEDDETKNSQEDDTESKSDPSDDEEKEQQDEENEAKRKHSPARKSARSEIQRKYANIYMNRGAQPKEEKSSLPPGIGWVRYNKCMMRANKDFDRAAYIARKDFDDPMMERHIKAMAVTPSSDGGFLVPEVYASEVIPLLRDKAIVMRLGATELPMNNGNLNIPKLTGGASAGYVGELRKPKASKPQVGNIRMSGKKLMCKVVISNDLIRSNAYGADQLILNDATTAMALAMDRAALLGKGSEFEPKGLLNMDGIPTVDIGALPDESTTGTMLATLLQNNADTSKLGWAFNGFAWQAFYNVIGSVSGLYLYRDQLNEGKLTGHEIAVSNQISTGDGAGKPTKVILGNWNEYMIGRQGSMESEMFTQGTVTDEDGNSISAVDQDATILRIIDIHDFAVRHEESFVIGKNLHTA